MHPVLFSRANQIAYLLGWLVIGLACVGLTVALDVRLVHSLVFGGLTALLASLVFFPIYYPCLALRPEKTRPVILVLFLAIVGGCFGAIWAGAMYVVLYLLKRAEFGFFQMPQFLHLVVFGMVLCILCEAVCYIYIAHARAQEAARLEQESRTRAREAELRALRAQLNPHFLFNSLNSISALTTADPKSAREMCVLLSDFLRKSLRLGECLSVSLSEELDLMRNYLAIEQIRFGSRLSVDWDIDDAVLNAEIPTLMLQPLAENAIKHGISQLIDGGLLQIKADWRDNKIILILENPTDSNVETLKGLGLGIKQVHQRLIARFGDDAQMELESRHEYYKVRLVFPKIEKEVSNG